MCIFVIIEGSKLTQKRQQSHNQKFSSREDKYNGKDPTSESRVFSSENITSKVCHITMLVFKAYICTSLIKN